MTEYQKTMYHYNNGRDFGVHLGAEAMRQRILALPGIPQELAAQVKAIDVEQFKVTK